MSERRRVVITGAAGRIGRAVSARLDNRWDVVGTDRPGTGLTALDVTDPTSCRAAFAGADALVHLAAVPDPNAEWAELLPANVVGTYCVVEAAMQCGLRRLVLASSLQALSGLPGHLQLRTTDAPRPANLYGATKAWAEALGAWAVAASDVEVVALRIGYFSEATPDPDQVSVTEQAAWLSADDSAELIRAAVEGPVDGFTVINGISANRHRRAAYGDAERRLGYHPTDDTWA